MIGVFDSGVGGLSILRALLAELPAEKYIYLADSGHAPYGERDNAHVLARARAVTSLLRSQGIRAMVVACNTATALAIDTLREEHPDLPIIGVEPGLKPALAVSTTRRIGVMATRGTLNSERFRERLAPLGSDAAFVLQACDGLALAIDNSIGQLASMAEDKLRAECLRHIDAMGPFGSGPGEIDALVLGCTHYPLVSHVLRSLVGPDVELIDPGQAVARQTRLRLTDAGVSAIDNTLHARVKLQSTGDIGQLRAAARHWLNLQAGDEILPAQE